MTRGTTPSYLIDFDEEFDFDEVSKWTVTFSQRPVVLKKDDPLVDTVEKTLLVSLTQNETLRFKKGTMELQVRGLFADGAAFASDICIVPIEPVLDGRVLHESS